MTVPTLPTLLYPALLDGNVVVRKVRERGQKDAQNFNGCHLAQAFSEFPAGQHVWVTDQ